MSYQTLSEELQSSKDFFPRMLFLGKEPPEQVVSLCEVFESSFSAREEALCEKLVPMILHAVGDVEIVPHMTKAPAGHFYIPSENGKMILQSAGHARVEKAKLLLEKTWPHKFLQNIRKVLFAEIATWWRNTSDPAEADHLFELLLSYIGKGHYEESKIIEEATRKVTDGSFPSERLARHLTLLTFLDLHIYQDIIKILTAAWARGARHRDLFLRLVATESITERSREAHYFLGSVSNKLAQFDEAVKHLKAYLGDKDYSSDIKRPSEYEDVPGKLSIAYLSLEVVEISLEPSLSRLEKFDENQGHEWFESAKRNICLWQKQYPYTVKLKMKVRHFGEKFDREQIVKLKP